MRAFNRRKHKGIKKGYKSFTHIEIVYENCEHWIVPIKNVEIDMFNGYIKHMWVKIPDKIEGFLFNNNREDNLKRLTTDCACDITQIYKARISKAFDEIVSRKKIPIQHYIESNPISCYGNNILQSVGLYEGTHVLYHWVVDSRISVDYKYEHGWFSGGKIIIPSIYSPIIEKLDKEVWEVNEVYR